MRIAEADRKLRSGDRRIRELILEAAHAEGGCSWKIAKRLGVPHTTVLRWRQQYEELNLEIYRIRLAKQHRSGIRLSVDGAHVGGAPAAASAGSGVAG